jgi:hypothetical protein
MVLSVVAFAALGKAAQTEVFWLGQIARLASFTIHDSTI